MKSFFILLIIFYFLFFNIVLATNPLGVVINEVAWMGTQVSHNDEWIELYNNADWPVNLKGWVLKAVDGTPRINLFGSIPPKSFYLLERTDDNTVPEIVADQIYIGALNNTGEKLELYDNFGNLVDSLDASSGWPAGDNITKQTMERTDLGWQTSQNPGGTPKSKNSLLKTTEIRLLPKTKFPKNGEIVAVVGRQIPKENFYLPPLIIAPFIAIFSGIIILILKKKYGGPQSLVKN